ncbi:MAG: DUF5320 domain-containing protein [Candidatus Bathyarchaeota archaeon]|nr:MAG: DUF5320 domain-containing protein [Candidatus Bathyarchaeota archaeon]
MCHDDLRAHCHPFLRRRHAWKRRFFTDEEKEEMKKHFKEMKMKWMEQYKESLEQELKGVTERLEKLKQ